MDEIIDLVGELKLETPEDIALAEAEIAKTEAELEKLQGLLGQLKEAADKTAT